jgi:hypothetical protein
LNFFNEYKDPETYEKVRDVKKIARRYVFKGTFIIDIIAIIPF